MKTASVERLLFWMPFLSFTYFYQGADQSIAARFDLMRSIIERRTLWIDGYCGYNTADIISLGGHYYSVKAPGGSFTGILQWIVWTVLLSPLKENHEALYWALATWLTTVFATSLIVAISCVVMYRLIILLGGAQSRAILCALLMPFATILFPYATEMTGEPIAGACALIAFYMLASQQHSDDPGRMMLAGMLAGWAVLCDFPALLISAAPAVYALWQLGFSRHFAVFIGGAAAIALILLAYNRGAFGNPFFLSYEAYKLAGNTQFPEQAVGFVGLKYPRPEVLYRILLDPQRGLFYCNPVLLLSIPGFVFMAMRPKLRVAAALAAFATLSMILFNASFGESIVSWGGGTATGPRQIVAAIPFMVIPLAFLPPRWNWPIALLASVSVAAMVMATAVEPHFPYEYANPLRDFALQGYLRGDFAYDCDAFFGGAAVVDESTAFNLGKLAGLPGPFQLWPLAALWLWSSWSLLRYASGARLPRGASRRVRELRNEYDRNANRRWIEAAMIGALLLLCVLPFANRIAARLRSQPRHGLLGRYYRELRLTRFPPHLERVDRELNFDNAGELGGLPAPSRVTWTGTLQAPLTGEYRFVIEADDLGWLTIDGLPVIPDPGDVTQTHSENLVYLTKGSHRIEAGERNLAGDAMMRLLWQPPGAQLEIIPPSALTPN